MKRIALALAVLILVAAPSFAAIKACTAGMVTGGYCRAQANTFWGTDLTPTSKDELVAALLALNPYSANLTVLCDQAQVTAGHCTSGQIGQQVTYANPETQAQFLDRIMRNYFIDMLRRIRETAAIRTEANRVNALPNPDAGN